MRKSGIERARERQREREKMSGCLEVCLLISQSVMAGVGVRGHDPVSMALVGLEKRGNLIGLLASEPESNLSTSDKAEK